MSRKRTRSSKAAAPVTGVAAGNLGTGANLDETQVLETEDLRAAAPESLADTGPEPVVPAPTPAPVPAPAYQASPARMPAARPAAPRTSPRRRSGSRVRGRRLAFIGAGAFTVLVVLAGGGLLSQLDLGISGAAPSFPAFGVATQRPAPETPKPPPEGGKGHGHDGCRGRHCGD